MKRKNAFTFIVLLLLLLGMVGTAIAMSSPNFNLVKNTYEGGLVGGATSSSASYRLINSVGGIVQVDSVSSSFKLCSGFVCGLAELFIQKVFLPFTVRSSP
jgi:hypothetical protein